MTIRKGEQWGFPSVLPKGSPVVGSDAELAGHIALGLATGIPAVVGIAGGSIWAALGGESIPGRLHTEGAQTFPIDLGLVRVGDRSLHFVNAVVGHSRSWRRGFAVMNGQCASGLRFGHRSHPNDGLLDSTTWSLAWGDLRKVYRRARVGAHLPHPRIEEQRCAATRVGASSRWNGVLVDGRRNVDLLAGLSDPVLEFSIIADAGFVVL